MAVPQHKNVVLKHRSSWILRVFEFGHSYLLSSHRSCVQPQSAPQNHRSIASWSHSVQKALFQSMDPHGSLGFYVGSPQTHHLITHHFHDPRLICTTEVMPRSVHSITMVQKHESLVRISQNLMIYLCGVPPKLSVKSQPGLQIHKTHYFTASSLYRNFS